MFQDISYVRHDISYVKHDISYLMQVIFSSLSWICFRCVKKLNNICWQDNKSKFSAKNIFTKNEVESWRPYLKRWNKNMNVGIQKVTMKNVRNHLRAMLYDGLWQIARCLTENTLLAKWLSTKLYRTRKHRTFAIYTVYKLYIVNCIDPHCSPYRSSDLSGYPD